MDAPMTTRRDAYLSCLVAALALLSCAALVGAAVVAHAPPAIAPLLALACVGCPVALAWSLPPAVAVLHRDRLAVRAARRLRRDLDRLPEIPHPRGY
jgi:hypothetical protein